jgi:hypothetical protein
VSAYYNGADGIVIVYDLSSWESFQVIDELIVGCQELLDGRGQIAEGSQYSNYAAGRQGRSDR